MNNNLFCRCRNRFLHQVADMRLCCQCRQWVCVDCLPLHKELYHKEPPETNTAGRLDS